MSENKDKVLIKMLIETYPYNFSTKSITLRDKIIDKDEKLVWKDFLLYFKKGFSPIVSNIHTKIISDILRELLNIDQALHVRSGIKLSFEEWIGKK